MNGDTIPQNKKIQKTLDKPPKVCYNKYVR